MIRYIMQGWRLVVVWVVSLIAVGAAASTLTLAQTAPDTRIVSGNDIGFRIDSERNGVPTGRLVIRMNGQWVEPKEAVGPSKLTR